MNNVILPLLRCLRPFFLLAILLMARSHADGKEIFVKAGNLSGVEDGSSQTSEDIIKPTDAITESVRDL
jgi:hypothetical protein